MSDIIRTNGVTVRIELDTDPESPREWDNLGTMVCFHSRHTLGDVQPKCSPEEFREGLAIDADSEIEEIKDRVDRVHNHFYPGHGKTSRLAQKIANAYLTNKTETCLDDNYIIVSLFLYDHGGLCMKTNSFECPWDSGQVGWIYVTKEKVIKEYGAWDADIVGRAMCHLQDEVERYSQWLEGDIYGYMISYDDDDDDEVLDSCWGFYGRDECEKEALLVAGKYEYVVDYSDVNCGVFN